MPRGKEHQEIVNRMHQTDDLTALDAIEQLAGKGEFNPFEQDDGSLEPQHKAQITPGSIRKLMDEYQIPELKIPEKDNDEQ